MLIGSTMRAFDFDGTLYDGDSSIDFYAFLLSRRPSCIRFLPRFFVGFLQFVAGRKTRTAMKEDFFSFLRACPAVEDDIEAFWKNHRRKLKPSLMRKVKCGDLVVSASPEFLLKPICAEMGVVLIASVVDVHTGCFLSPNCRGEEKIRRVRQACQDDEIEEFYTDSLIDAPLARYAKKSYLVEGSRVESFPEEI